MRSRRFEDAVVATFGELEPTREPNVVNRDVRRILLGAAANLDYLTRSLREDAEDLSDRAALFAKNLGEGRYFDGPPTDSSNARNITEKSIRLSEALRAFAALFNALSPEASIDEVLKRQQGVAL